MLSTAVYRLLLHMASHLSLVSWSIVIYTEVSPLRSLYQWYLLRHSLLAETIALSLL